VTEDTYRNRQESAMGKRIWRNCQKICLGFSTRNLPFAPTCALSTDEIFE